MERLEIRNFLTIKEADIDVKRFTVLIGPQASGKSVVAKLLYFFREFLSKQFVHSIWNLKDKHGLYSAGLERFDELFPPYGWMQQSFSVFYKCGDVEVNISGGGAESSTLRIILSKKLLDIYDLTIRKYQEEWDKIQAGINGDDPGIDQDGFWTKDDLFWEKIVENIYGDKSNAFRSSIFIPASRAFFSAVLKNVFSLISNSVLLDPLIIEFGSSYEHSKQNYIRISSSGKPRPWHKGKWSDAIDFLNQAIEKILAGKYVHERGEDWIVSSNGQVNIAHASSGQQEILPMLIVLLSRAYYMNSSKPTTFFIEEPEAHLFPTAQRHVVEFLASLYNLTGCNYFITTHSPYILTALNNLIYAGNLAQQESLREQVKEIVPEEIQVSFDDVSAYVMENGGIKSILDPELKIIGASVIDEVSNDFDAVFSKLLELEAAHG